MPLAHVARLATFAIGILLLLGLHIANTTPSDPKSALSRRQTTTNTGHWVTVWTAMPQLTEPANLPPPPFNASPAIFANTTLRQTLHIPSTPATTTTTTRIRLRLSNAFGLTPLTLSALTLALPSPINSTNSTTTTGSPAIHPSTLHPLTFNGGLPANTITIPPGALAVTDALDIDATTAADLSITLYLLAGQPGTAITGHPGSRTDTWLALGDHTSATTLADAPAAASLAHWYYISAIEAWAPRSAATLALVGDSLTDGRGSTTNANNRWPDALGARLQTLNTGVAIANQAAGGNRVLADGLGPAALARFDRDVLAASGVRWALVFAGVNDVGGAAATDAAQQAVGDALIGAYKQLVLRGRAAGVAVLGATLTPFCAEGCAEAGVQPYSSEVRERTRQRVNAWVREGGWFDAVVDFDEAVRDPQAGERLRAEYDSGDYLHLNPKGYEAMAQAFPVDVFEEFADGVDGWA